MSGKVLDITGRRFGRLIVLRFIAVRQTQAVWRVRCDCGRTRSTITRRLQCGDLKSCGHCALLGYHGEGGRKKATKEYRTWMAMRARCKRGPTYVRRKIRVCARWHRFENFLADMGRAPKGPTRHVTIERKDNSKGYNPSNCVWSVSYKAQMRNKVNNRLLHFKGRTQSFAAWADELNIPYHWLYDRVVRKKWSMRVAVAGAAR